MSQTQALPALAKTRLQLERTFENQENETKGLGKLSKSSNKAAHFKGNMRLYQQTQKLQRRF